jgi:glycosyltransferase involved in cell wall biosynthesis
MTADSRLRITPVAPRHVVHLVWNFDGGGLESLVVALASRLQGTPIRTSVISLSGRTGRIGEQTRGLYEHLLAVRPARAVSMLYPGSLARAIAGTGADVAHLHSGVWYKGARAARMAGVKRVIFTEHGREHHDPPTARWLDRRAAALTDVVVPVSTRLEHYLRDRVGIPASKLHTIENGVDTVRFAPDAAAGAAARARLGIPRDAFVLGSIGRLERVKGFDRLLEVFALVRRAPMALPVVLLLCGDGAERDALRATSTALGIADGVVFAGWVDRPEDMYRAMDVFAMTSRSEGLSLSLLEAMACGVVPVVNDVGANAENLGPDLASQLVRGDDWAHFARVVIASLADRNRAVRVGEAGRRRVLERYDLDRVAEAYARLYAGSPD